MIENILILDTETTGLYPEKGDQVIEVGAILYNLKYRCSLQSFATLFPCETNPVEHINHISAKASQQLYNVPAGDVVLMKMLECAQAVVAHNAKFDKKFIDYHYNLAEFNDIPWICTKENFRWPFKLHRYRLQDICESMGVPYVDAHRALNDCYLLAQCFGKVDDLEQRFANANNHTILIPNKNTFDNMGTFR